MIITPLELADRYFSFDAWREALALLRGLTPDSPDDDDLVPFGSAGMKSRIMTYSTRGPESGVLEAHDRFVDLQMTLHNAEAIDWFPRATLQVKTPYNPDRDVVFFHRPEAAPSRVENRPFILSVYFPEDAHMAQQLMGATPELVKKVVIKVPLELFP